MIMKIFCISIRNQNLNFFKKNNLIPVGLGKSTFDENWLNDKSQINISEKNEHFGEFTFHYWLWKNNILDKEDVNWIGFCGYRRFWVNKKFQIPNNFEELNQHMLKEPPDEWDSYESIITSPIILKKEKLTKLLKRNFIYLLRKPSLIYKRCTIRDHFIINHSEEYLNASITFLPEKDKDDFNKFLESYEFNPYCLFICKKYDLLKKFYNELFPWLEKCENKFKHKNLTGYGKKRIYAFLAERYISYWFKKYSNYLEWPCTFFDSTKKY